MGNNQSSPNHHNRLSKPKTNTNSPSPALVVESPVSVSSRYTDLSAKGRQQLKETLVSPVDTESGAVAWPNKDEDGVGELGLRTWGRPSSVISRSNSRTNSRSNSLSCFGGSRQESTARLAELQHGSKISLVSNTRMDLETAIRLLQEVKKNASPEELAALHEALESSSDTAPISVTEGLSRRTSVANGSCSSLTRRRSLVQTPGVATRISPVDRRKTWNSWKAPKMAPEQEAKWAVTPKGITPASRSAALGIAKDSHGTQTPRAQTPGEMDYSHLGSLKLGTLSIVNGAPSPAPSTKVPKLRSRPAGEDDYFSAAEVGASPLMMKSTRRRGHVKSKSSVLPVTAPLYSSIPEPQRSPPSPPPLNQKHTSTLPGPQQQQTCSRTPSAYPITKHIGSELANLSPVTNQSTIPQRYDDSKYAQDYQAYIPYSPFANATFSINDDKDADTRSTEAREEVARILTGTIFDAPTTAIETSGSSLFTATSAAPVPKQQITKPYQRPTPQTADSGYSSGGSLRTGSRSPQSAVSTMSSKTGKFSMDSPRYLCDTVPHAANQVTDAKAYRHEPPSPHSTRQSGRAANVLSLNVTPSAGPPSQSELPSVQSCQSFPESMIPEIPENVRVQFARRLSHTPGMECLTHTYPSKDHVTTTEFKSGDYTSDASDEIFTQLTELELERPLTSPVHGRRTNLSLFRRKSVVRSGHADKEDINASPGVVDLGSIATSLGSSPYDAAVSRSQRKTVTSPTHPHQLGAALPRAKSMVSMDSQAAAEFARIRSKDRALIGSEMPQQQRRRSYHNLKMEVGEAKALKRRPQSSLHDIPPVPTIDSSMLKAPLSARPRLESGIEQKTNLSFGGPSYTKGQVDCQRTDRYKQDQTNISQHNVDWDAHSRHWRQHRKSIGEGLRVHAGLNESSASTVNSRNVPPPCNDMASWGRYSGGLEYNYEGRGNISSSAGTRQLHSAASSKSLKWRNQYGVDLSDVPIMLQRA